MTWIIWRTPTATSKILPAMLPMLGAGEVVGAPNACGKNALKEIKNNANFLSWA